MLRVGFRAALALLAAPAAAQGPEPQQGRIWKGTLGTQAITACFFEADGRDGVYYADAVLAPIRIEVDEDAGPTVLRELRRYDDPTGAVWLLTASDGGGLAGEWRMGAVRLSIRLAAHSVTLPDYASACETGAFLDPLLAGGTVTSERESLDGTDYTRLAYQGPLRAGLEDYGLTTFALDPVRPGDAAINAALAKALPVGTASQDMAICYGSALRTGIGGYQEAALEPLAITPRWLGVRHSIGDYCGGPHPNYAILMATYDRESGAEIDTTGWFKPGALVFYEFEASPPAGQRAVAGLSKPLKAAVLARYPAGEDRAECADIAGEAFGWQIGFTREGPLFVPQLPHVAFACTEEIVLPWAQARPFLSGEGRAVAAGLR